MLRTQLVLIALLGTFFVASDGRATAVLFCRDAFDPDLATYRAVPAGEWSRVRSLPSPRLRGDHSTLPGAAALMGSAQTSLEEPALIERDGLFYYRLRTHVQTVGVAASEFGVREVEGSNVVYPGGVKLSLFDLPLPETLNALFELRTGVSPVAFAAYNDPEQDEVPEVLYWRFLADGIVLISTGSFSAFRHDILIHAAGSIALAKLPTWPRFTSILRRVFFAYDRAPTAAVRDAITERILKPLSMHYEYLSAFNRVGPGADATAVARYNTVDFVFRLRQLDQHLDRIASLLTEVDPP